MASRTGTILQGQDRVRSLRLLLLALVVSLTLGAWGEPGWAQGSQPFHEGLHHCHPCARNGGAFRPGQSDSLRLPCG